MSKKLAKAFFTIAIPFFLYSIFIAVNKFDEVQKLFQKPPERVLDSNQITVVASSFCETQFWDILFGNLIVMVPFIVIITALYLLLSKVRVLPTFKNYYFGLFTLSIVSLITEQLILGLTGPRIELPIVLGIPCF